MNFHDFAKKKTLSVSFRGLAAPEPPPVGYRLCGITWGTQNLINRCFDYHIRNQRGRFTPGGSLLKEFFWNFDFFCIFCIFSSKTIVFLYKSTLGISESDFSMKLPHLWYWRNEFVLFFKCFFNFFHFLGSAFFVECWRTNTINYQK